MGPFPCFLDRVCSILQLVRAAKGGGGEEGEVCGGLGLRRLTNHMKDTP